MDQQVFENKNKMYHNDLQNYRDSFILGKNVDVPSWKEVGQKRKIKMHFNMKTDVPGHKLGCYLENRASLTWTNQFVDFFKIILVVVI